MSGHGDRSHDRRHSTRPVGRSHGTRLATDLVDAWGCWGPTLTADGRQMAYVSDRSGVTALWVQANDGGSGWSAPSRTASPSARTRCWRPTGRPTAPGWPAAVASGGGVRSEVWVVRPDGTDGRRVAGGDGRHAVLGPWARRGHRLTVTVHEDADGRVGGTNRCMLLDPVDRLHRGPGRPARCCASWTSPRTSVSSCAATGPAAPNAAGCSTAPRGTRKTCCRSPRSAPPISGILRPAHHDADAAMIVYLVTDAGLAPPRPGRRAHRADGRRGHVGAIAQRDDAELELVDADRDGRTLLLVWNVGGRSEVELIERSGRDRRPVDLVPGTVVGGGVLSRDGSRAVLSVESPQQPSPPLRAGGAHRRLDAAHRTPRSTGTGWSRRRSSDSSPTTAWRIEGWLYRAPAAPVGAAPGARLPARGTRSPGAAGLQPPPPAAGGRRHLRLRPQHPGLGRLRPRLPPRRRPLRPARRHRRRGGLRPPPGGRRPGRPDPSRRGRPVLRRLRRAHGPGALSRSLRRRRGRVRHVGPAHLLPGHRALDRPGRRRPSTATPTRRLAAGPHLAHAPPEADAGPRSWWCTANWTPTCRWARPASSWRPCARLGRPVEYLELAGEGHEYRRRSSRLSLLRTELEFLRRTLAAVHEQPEALG